MAKKRTRNGRTIDPTENVMALVSGQVKRLNDLALANAQLAKSETKRIDALHKSEYRHIHEMATLRTEFDAAQREKETERIDAIRAVDVAAVQRAAEVQAQLAQTLQTTVQATAEALRTQVAATQTLNSTQLATALEPIQKSIEELRKTQYEQQGQKAAQVESRVVKSEDRGSSQWTIGTIVVIVGVVGSMFFSIAAIVVAIILHFIK